MKFKMTPLERKWVWYDVGNSAFTLLVSTLIPIFFSAVAGSEEKSATVALGYATSIATAAVAILGPVLGSLSDLRGMRKLIFSASVLVGALGCVVLGFMQHWLWFLVLFVLAKSAYQLSLVVYDSMLCDVTQRERMDEVSSRGYAWGYIGSCLPFVVTVVVYVLYAMPDLFVGEGQTILSLQAAMILVFLITAVWWVACTLPLWRSYKQVNYVERGDYVSRLEEARFILSSAQRHDEAHAAVWSRALSGLVPAPLTDPAQPANCRLICGKTIGISEIPTESWQKGVDNSVIKWLSLSANLWITSPETEKAPPPEAGQ